MNLDYYANVPKNELYISIFNELCKTVMNPHSSHFLSNDAKVYLDKSYNLVKTLFPNYIFFEFIQGGGSNANTRAIFGQTKIRTHAKVNDKDIVLVSSIEHSSISKYMPIVTLLLTLTTNLPLMLVQYFISTIVPSTLEFK